MRHTAGGAVAASTIAVLCGCGAAQSSTSPPAAGPASASALPSAAAAATGLFAVLEGSDGKDPNTHSQVVIVGPDGSARARASFTPRSPGGPQICDAVSWLMPEAYTAAGSVFFVDGTGVVRRLDSSGSVQRVTAFPFDSATQVLSFVVSPDGRQLMATILTVPTPLPSTTQGCGSSQGDYVLDTYLAAAGGTARRVSHVDAGPTPYPASATSFRNLLLIGWDSAGPLADAGAAWAVQNNPWPGTKALSGQLTRLNSDGSIGADVGGSGCTPYAAPVADRTICIPSEPGNENASVRTLSGSVLWTGPTRSLGCCAVPVGAVSPDGSQFAREGQLVQLGSGATRPLSASCQPSGWIDATTILCGGAENDDLGVVHLADPGTFTDWHFTASFVGRLLPS